MWDDEDTDRTEESEQGSWGDILDSTINSSDDTTTDESSDQS